jgi:CBS domain-containing protein
VDPNTPVASAEQTIADDRWRQALVLDDNILVGIVALADLGGGIAV